MPNRILTKPSRHNLRRQPHHIAGLIADPPRRIRRHLRPSLLKGSPLPNSPPPIPLRQQSQHPGIPPNCPLPNQFFFGSRHLQHLVPSPPPHPRQHRLAKKRVRHLRHHLCHGTDRRII